MKKIISITMCFLIIVSSFSLNAFANNADLVNPPSKTVFYEGEDWQFYNSEITLKSDFDLKGTVIRYNNKDIPYTVMPWGGNMYCRPVSEWALGSNDVNIYLDDYNNVYATTKLTLVAIQSIELVKGPDKSELIEGIDWEYDALHFIKLKNYHPYGARIKVNYTDGTYKNVSYGNASALDWRVPSSVIDFELGQNAFELVYYGHTAGYTVNFEKVHIDKAEIKSKPSKTSYNFKTDWTYSGDTLVPAYNFSGLSVNLTYNDGNVETVTYNNSPDRFKIQPVSDIKLGKNQLCVTIDNVVTTEITIELRGYGDINFDGKVNSSDALTILQYTVGLVRLTGVPYKYANVSGDNVVNSSDALLILQRSVGSVNKFKAETL